MFHFHAFEGPRCMSMVHRLGFGYTYNTSFGRASPINGKDMIGLQLRLLHYVRMGLNQDPRARNLDTWTPFHGVPFWTQGWTHARCLMSRIGWSFIFFSWDQQDLVGKWCHICANPLLSCHILWIPTLVYTPLRPKLCSRPTWNADLRISLILDHDVNPPFFVQKGIVACKRTSCPSMLKKTTPYRFYGWFIPMLLTRLCWGL